jgi:hypothetical protein
VTDRPESPDTSGSAETAEIAEVRRLLAEARHTEPMPGDVGARLDQVLAGLAAESAPRAIRPPAEPPGDRARDDVVVPIAAHRRRRVAGLLVAAAAAVVGGVTIAPHLTSDSGSGTTDAAPDRAGISSGLGNEDAPEPEKVPGPAKGLDGLQLEKGRVVIRPRHFSIDARQGQALLQADASASAAKVPCPDVRGPGHRVAAEYQHAPAVLVYRRVKGSTQVVDLYVCGNDRAVRSTTLPVP